MTVSLGKMQYFFHGKLRHASLLYLQRRDFDLWKLMLKV